MSQHLVRTVGHAISLLQEVILKNGPPDAQRKRREALALLHAALDELEAADRLERVPERETA